MMNLVSALMVTRMLTRDHVTNEGIPFGSVWWFVYAGISCFLVIFAGIMSGLILGLMSLGLVDLEILQCSGSPSEKKQAAVILPVVQKQHQLLVTLLLCNAAAMEVPADMPLYDILNEFQKGSSHMAAVVKTRGKGKATPQIIGEKYEEDKKIGGDSQLTAPLLRKQDEKSESIVVDIDKPSRPLSINKLTALRHSDAATNGSFLENIEDGEVIGIITLEDVFEELLQEEIVD